jgi:hypothetical protein
MAAELRSVFRLRHCNLTSQRRTHLGRGYAAVLANISPAPKGPFREFFPTT